MQASGYSHRLEPVRAPIGILKVRSEPMSKSILHALAAILLFATMAAAQISGLCNTGQTRVEPRHVVGNGCSCPLLATLSLR